MLDQERNPKTSYRVMFTGDLYVVSTYPKSPDSIAVAAYRFDLLPLWIQETVRLLDWAHPEDVKGLGRRIGDDTYWVEALDYTDATTWLQQHNEPVDN